MSRSILVVCPRCHRKQEIPETSSGADCDCHLYCDEGSKPRDCVTNVISFDGQLGWPVGAHQNSENEGDDVVHRVRYCSTHEKYIYKTPVFLEADSTFFEDRLPEKYRMFQRR